jgi:cytochrome c biogenesis protein CcmG, thiol:disulfide interchange protein DsbE
MNRTVLIVGLVVTAALVGILYVGLGKDPQAIDSPLVGRPAPAFALREAGAGGSIDLAQYRGKPVIINFWATWCVPCFQEHPVLVSSARMLGDRVVFLGVVFDDKEPTILQFLREHGQSYPTLMDSEGKTAIAYGVGGVPETFFVNPAGTIVAKYAGPLSPDLLQANLAKALR